MCFVEADWFAHHTFTRRRLLEGGVAAGLATATWAGRPCFPGSLRAHRLHL